MCVCAAALISDTVTDALQAEGILSPADKACSMQSSGWMKAFLPLRAKLCSERRRSLQADRLHVCMQSCADRCTHNTPLRERCLHSALSAGGPAAASSRGPGAAAWPAPSCPCQRPPPSLWLPAPNPAGLLGGLSWKGGPRLRMPTSAAGASGKGRGNHADEVEATCVVHCRQKQCTA